MNTVLILDSDPEQSVQEPCLFHSPHQLFKWLPAQGREEGALPDVPLLCRQHGAPGGV